MAARMSLVLLDTDVFSYGIKRDTRAAQFTEFVRGSRVCIAFVTVAETYRWALAHRWGAAKRQALEQSIDRCVVLPYDSDVARCWAQIMVARSSVGRPIMAHDC